MKRIVLWLVAAAIVAIFVLSTPASLAAQDVNSAAWGEVTGDGVRVRAGASENYKIMRVANKGERVVVIGEKNGWAMVQANAATPCWISARYVKRSGNSGVVTGGPRVNLRLEAKAENLPIGQVEKGDNLQIIGEASGWFRIVPPPGVAVYIHGDFVKRAGSLAPGEFAAWLGGKQFTPASSDTISADAEIRPNPEAVAQRKREDQERDTYEGLVQRFNDVLAKTKAGDKSASLLEAIAELAYEFRAFADSCTTDIGASAQNQADFLQQTHEMMQQAAAELDQQKRALKEQELKIKAEREAAAQRERDAKDKADRDAKSWAAQKRAQEEAHNNALMARLLYVEPAGYTASGIVDDVRDSNGRKVFVLKADGRVVCQLRVPAGASDLNLAQLWQREVGIRGRTVTIDGEKWPVLICETIDAR